MNMRSKKLYLIHSKNDIGWLKVFGEPITVHLAHYTRGLFGKLGLGVS